MLRDRIKHLSGSFYPERASSYTDADRATLAKIIGAAISSTVWDALRELGTVTLSDAYIVLPAGERPAVDTFYDVAHAIAHANNCREQTPLPTACMPLASLGVADALLGLQGAAQGTVLHWLGGTHNVPPNWRDDVVELLFASIDVADDVRDLIVASKQGWGPRWQQLRDKDPQIASWLFTRPVAASLPDFLDSIRSRPRPNFAQSQSSRVAGIASDILAGFACRLEPSGAQWLARLSNPTDASAGSQLRMLSDDEATLLREFCAWHDGYQARGCSDVELPDFVGPRGLQAVHPAPAKSGPAPTAVELWQAMADALDRSTARPLELWIDIGQTYDAASFTLHCEGDGTVDVQLPDLDLWAGEHGRFRDRRRSPPFDQALIAVQYVLLVEPLKSALARCRAKNASFQFRVTGPYDECRIAQHAQTI